MNVRVLEGGVGMVREWMGNFGQEGGKGGLSGE